jgi:hypothetical protein
VRFFCCIGAGVFEVEITPDFEARPIEWSVQLRRTGFSRPLPVLWRPAQEMLRWLLNGGITSDERFTLLKWASLAALSREQANRTR